MKKTNADGVSYHSIPDWDERFSAPHGFFARTGGVSPAPYASLNVGVRGEDSPAHVRENLKRAAAALSIPADKVFCAAQVHGDRIHAVSGDEPSIFGADPPLQGDGLITARKGLYLGVLTADCVPLLLLDPVRSVVGAVHAGWRGTEKGIAAKAVGAMCREFGCEPSDILAAIGPAVGQCCYVVGDEVARAFMDRDPRTGPFLHALGSGRWKLHLEGINRHQLIDAGVGDENITPLSLCTSCCSDRFFSVRADGEPTGRQIALIGLRPDRGLEG
jgi:YfiH family protein